MKLVKAEKDALDREVLDVARRAGCPLSPNALMFCVTLDRSINLNQAILKLVLDGKLDAKLKTAVKDRTMLTVDDFLLLEPK